MHNVAATNKAREWIIAHTPTATGSAGLSTAECAQADVLAWLIDTAVVGVQYSSMCFGPKQGAPARALARRGWVTIKNISPTLWVVRPAGAFRAMLDA